MSPFHSFGRSWAVMAIVVFCWPVNAAEAQTCSVAIANPSCTASIDRDSPVTPLPFKMKRGAVATIVVSKRPTETIQMDATATDVAPPDPIAAIFNAVLPSLSKILIKLQLVDPTDRGEIELRDPTFSAKVDLLPPAYARFFTRLAQVGRAQTEIKASLDAALTTAKAAAKSLASFRTKTVAAWNADSSAVRQTQQKTIVDELHAAAATSPGGRAAVARATLDAITREVVVLPVPQDPAERARLDALLATLGEVTLDQGRLEAGVKMLDGIQNSLAEAADVVVGLDMDALSDRETFSSTAVDSGRSIAIKVAAQDKISKGSTTLATVTFVWNDTRWEVSGGVIFSQHPNRKFENAAIIVDGVPQRDDRGAVRTTVRETLARPTVVPMALGHYRLHDVSVNGRRLAVLASGGIGVNAGSGTADFAWGLSASYRLFVLSVLRHHGQDVRLTNGVAPGMELSPSPPPPPTERFWTKEWHWAVGVGVRVPF